MTQILEPAMPNAYSAPWWFLDGGCIGRSCHSQYPLVDISVPDYSTISRLATLAARESANVLVGAIRAPTGR